MALRVKVIQSIDPVKKSTSQGTGGRSRRIKISMAHMNKHKKRSYKAYSCLLYTSPSPRDGLLSRMPSSA